LVIVALVATFLPFILLFIYFIYVWVDYNNPNVDLTRIRLNIFGIISYIYFLVDYHFGFIGSDFVYTFFGKDNLDYLCFVNTALMLINVAFIFYGNRIFNSIDHGFVRIVYFLVIIYLLFKMFTIISSEIMPNIITQFDHEGYKKEKQRKEMEEERIEREEAEEHFKEEMLEGDY
jgi:CBS domain containing-hemolysin-like protein